MGVNQVNELVVQWLTIILQSPLIAGVATIYLGWWKFRGGIKKEVTEIKDALSTSVHTEIEAIKTAFSGGVTEEMSKIKKSMREEVDSWKKTIFSHLEAVKEEMKGIKDSVKAFGDTLTKIEKMHVQDTESLSNRVGKLEAMINKD
jgi:gas vesicle protein